MFHFVNKFNLTILDYVKFTKLTPIMYCIFTQNTIVTHLIGLLLIYSIQGFHFEYIVK